MKHVPLVPLVAVLLLLPLLPACQSADGADRGAVSPVARGEYLVTVTGCNDCHTPLTMTAQGPVPDAARLLSGHPGGPVSTSPALAGEWVWAGTGTNTAFAGPWGVSYAPNLTPDDATGLGGWTETMFANAMRQGKHLGSGRPIMPPMPWMGYGKMTDDDLAAVFAYLQSLPAIENRVPEWQPPAAATVAASMP